VGEVGGLASRELASLIVLQNVSFCWGEGGLGTEVPREYAVIAIVAGPRWGRWETGALCLMWSTVRGAGEVCGEAHITYRRRLTGRRISHPTRRRTLSVLAKLEEEY
jgi:hypothetical protein